MGVDLGGGNLRGVEGGEIVIRIYSKKTKINLSPSYWFKPPLSSNFK
jgi:hypothetical protein